MENDIKYGIELSKEELKNASRDKSFQERSDIALEIISRKPDFWERWALFIFIGLVALLFAGAWFIRYPDFVEGSAVIIGEKPPSEVITKQSGKLGALRVKNGQQVKKGDVIALIEGNAPEKNYTVLAPGDGTLMFALPLPNNQYIPSGKLLGYVASLNNRYYAEVQLPQKYFFKVDSGMKVQLRIDAYPYQEVGFVPGQLDYISSVSVNGSILGTVKLSEGLITNQNKKLPYKIGLKARAVIIIKDSRLLQRFYYNIIKSASIKK